VFKKNKTGISPLISTILIVGITIVASVLVITWLSQVSQLTIETQEETIENSTYCMNIHSNLEAESSFDPGDPDTQADDKVTVNIVALQGNPPETINVILKDQNGIPLKLITLSSSDFQNDVATIEWVDPQSSEVKQVEVMALV
jgi:FlaG/FlaF family flagellin (archaellin)